MTNPLFDVLFKATLNARNTMVQALRDGRAGGTPCAAAWKLLCDQLAEGMARGMPMMEAFDADPIPAVMSAAGDGVLMLIEAGYPLDDIMPALRENTVVALLGRKVAADD